MTKSPPIIEKDLSELKRDPDNPREVMKEAAPEQYRALGNITDAFGLVDPIIYRVKDGLIIGGHQRSDVYLEKGKTKGYSIILGDIGWWFYETDIKIKSDEDATALNLGLNKIAGLWNEAKLKLNIQKLQLKNYRLDLTGFTKPELEALSQPPQLKEKDPVEDDPNIDIEKIECQVKPGQLWKLGDHQLYCGDSTKTDDLTALMGVEIADMIFTDPPYNVDYDPEARESYFSPERKKKPLGKIDNDKKSPEEFRNFLDQAYSNMNTHLKAGGGIYICHADSEGHHFRNAFIAQPWYLASCLIWKKTVLVFGRSDYHWMHEPLLYGWKEGAKHIWTGDRKQTTIIELPTDHYNKANSDTNGKYLHPTQKPVSLAGVAMKNSSSPGDIILDPFGGSGSTIIAAEQLNRHAYLMEFTPLFCDVIIHRWENFTGEKAEQVT